LQIQVRLSLSHEAYHPVRLIGALAEDIKEIRRVAGYFRNAPALILERFSPYSP
jgi:hypothetical protein